MTSGRDNINVILAIANHKGGVGKTTIAHAIGAELARRGRRVLLVDLDPQASLTAAAGIDAAGRSLAEVIGGAAAGKLAFGASLREIAPGLDLAPADLDLAAAELGLVQRLGRETVIARALHDVRTEYDSIILDCPPSLGLLTVAGLVAAHGVLVPTGARIADLRAVKVFIQSVEAIRSELNYGLRVLGVIPTFYDARRRHDREAIEAMRAGGLPVWEPVPASVKVTEAAASGVDAIAYAGGDNPAALAMLRIAEGVITWQQSGLR